MQRNYHKTTPDRVGWGWLGWAGVGWGITKENNNILRHCLSKYLTAETFKNCGTPWNII